MATGRLPDPNTAPLTAKGDLYTYSTVPARLAVGSNGDTLVADSSASTGLRWQALNAAGKNRIINGNMVIDQRNAGASVTVDSGTAKYPVDRFLGFGTASAGVFTLQQDSSAPAGFTKSVKATVTTADASIAASDIYGFQQFIEGNQIFDFGLGTASAQTFTLSFWVRSSLTGTFGGSIRPAGTTSYVFSYSISVADTWEKKTITIPGTAFGTWNTNENTGMRITWSLGEGSNGTAAAGSWYDGQNYRGATGQVQWISTLNATWYISGVQLEKGSVATPFTLAGGTFAGELALAQRYFTKSYNSDVAPGTATATGGVAVRVNGTGVNNVTIPVQYKVTMRATPTVTIYSGTGVTTQFSNDYAGTTSFNNVNVNNSGMSGFNAENSTTATSLMMFHYTASAEL